MLVQKARLSCRCFILNGRRIIITRTAIENFRTIKSILLLGGFFGFSRCCFSGGCFLFTLSSCAGFCGSFSAFLSSLRFFNNLDYLDGNSGYDYARLVNDVDIFDRGRSLTRIIWSAVTSGEISTSIALGMLAGRQSTVNSFSS